MDTAFLLPNNLLNSVNDYVSILDNESNFIQVNHKQMTIMGYRSTTDIIGRTYHQFRKVPVNVVEKFIVQDISVLKNNHSLRYLSYRKYSDGNWHLLLGDKCCIVDDIGHIIGIFSQAKDITNYRMVDISRFMLDSNKRYTKNSNNRVLIVLFVKLMTSITYLKKKWRCFFISCVAKVLVK